MSRLAEILGVEDGEVFKIKQGIGYVSETSYFKVSKNGALEILSCNEEGNEEWSPLFKAEYYKCLINGEYKIIRQPKIKITDDEKECLNYYAKRGFHWFTKDKCGVVFVYNTGEIEKDDQMEFWFPKIEITGKECAKIEEQELSFLSWEDEEPFYWEGESK